MTSEKPGDGSESCFEEGADHGADVAVAEEEPELHTELVVEGASSLLFTRGVREIVPWPVEILNLPDPTEPELLATGTRERHGECAVGTAQTALRPLRCVGQASPALCGPALSYVGSPELCGQP